MSKFLFKKGHKVSQIIRNKISRAKKRKSTWNKGGKLTTKWKNKIRRSLIGHKVSDETRKKLRKSHRGMKKPWVRDRLIKLTKEEHPNWQGGKSFEPYGLEFNENLKEVIRNRDRRKCKICEKTELKEGKKLSVHHIDYDKKNNNPNNLITLCVCCHIKTNYNKKYWIKYFLK